MQSWRYHSLVIRDLTIADSKLNAEGEKGWELVSIFLVDQHSARAFFKMPGDAAPVETHAAVDSVFSDRHAAPHSYGDTHPYPEAVR